MMKTCCICKQEKNMSELIGCSNMGNMTNECKNNKYCIPSSNIEEYMKNYYEKKMEEKNLEEKLYNEEQVRLNNIKEKEKEEEAFNLKYNLTKITKEKYMEDLMYDNPDVRDLIRFRGSELNDLIYTRRIGNINKIIHIEEKCYKHSLLCSHYSVVSTDYGNYYEKIFLTKKLKNLITEETTGPVNHIDSIKNKLIGLGMKWCYSTYPCQHHCTNELGISSLLSGTELYEYLNEEHDWDDISNINDLNIANKTKTLRHFDYIKMDKFKGRNYVDEYDH